MEWLTIEEAARSLGSSPATVRRWASQGRLRAEKSGKAWLVSADEIRQIRVGAQPLDGVDLERSLHQLQRRDLQELWVPDVLDHADYLANPGNLVADAAERISRGGPFGVPLVIDVAKTAYLSRPGLLLSLPDRLAYHAAIETRAEAIRLLAPEQTYGGRPSTDKRFLLERGTTSWLRWRNDVIAAAEDDSTWVVKTDITAFFDQIQHRLLFLEWDRLAPPVLASSALKRMLGEWSGNTGVGIPQGPDASRLLANYYLFPIDELFGDSRWRYFRYMDDIRIVTDSRSAAVEALRLLERECRRRGLVLSAQKTKVLRGADAVRDLIGDDLTAAQYDLAAGRTKDGLRKVARILDLAMRQDEVNLRAARFSLYRLGSYRKRVRVDVIMESLERLAPLAPLVARYAVPWLSHPAAQARLATFLWDKNRNTSTYLTTWLLAAVVESSMSRSVIEWTRGMVRDRNQPSYQRAVGAVVLGRSHARTDLTILRDGANAEYDPIVARGYVVGLALADEFTKDLARTVAGRLPALHSTIDYVRQTTKFPSLLYASRSLGEANGP